MKATEMIKTCLAALAIACSVTPVVAAPAAPASRQLSEGEAGLSPLGDGQAIYEGVCQGCHMPGGAGAVGAGAYPALAGNRRLGVGAYAATVTMNGRGAMPPFKHIFNDEEIAEVVNYIRTNFGNRYTRLTAAEIKAMR